MISTYIKKGFGFPIRKTEEMYAPDMSELEIVTFPGVSVTLSPIVIICTLPEHCRLAHIEGLTMVIESKSELATRTTSSRPYVEHCR